MTGTVKVTFEPEGKAAFVLPGSLVLEAAARAGIIVETPCGGRGTCGKCRVIVRDGCSAPTATERRILKAKDLAAGLRLACQTRLLRDTAVTVPDASRFFEQRILTAGVGGATKLCPAVAKRALRLPEPSLEDQRADADRVLDGLGGTGAGRALRLDLGAARQLPAALRSRNHHVTVVLVGDEVIALEPGDTAARCFGVAFDIGTTTVVGSLLDLTSGHEVALGARTNPQVAFGDDVVARITYASDGGLGELQAKIVECLNDIVAEVAGKAGIPREAIYELTTVGNTTMNHLLLGLDPSHIAQMPFPAVVRQAMVVQAAELGIAVHPHARLYAMPNIAGFVGGDTVGVVLAADLMARRKPTLAVDIGTNGEMVLGTSKRLVACSTAAGPAFEGARIRFGMRAADGAIEQVRFGNDVETSVIGDAAPRGLCGSALIDAIAELLRAGIIEPNGRLRGPDELRRAKLPKAIRRRVVPGERGNDFILVHEGETALGTPILLTQGDVRQVQLAKGAIRAGIEVLKTELGLADAGIDAILLAGGFGNFIRRRNALRIGLLPPVEHARIHFIGNAALAGAKMALACTDYRAQADAISREVEYLELGGLPEFQAHFAEAMLFPEGE